MRKRGNTMYFEQGAYRLNCIKWWCEYLCEWHWAYTLSNKDGDRLMHISFGGGETPTADSLGRIVSTYEALKP